MAKGLNKVQAIGYLGDDPTMRYTAQGSAVTNFSVAVSRQWKSRDGEQQEETEWFRVVAWDKLGEICNQYLNKGSRVYIEGRLATRKWEDKDGQTRYTTEVVATDMIMLDSRGGRQDDDGEAPPPRQRSASGNGRVSRNQPQPIENDADLPF